MTVDEQRSLNEVLTAILNFKSDMKDSFRDLKDDNRNMRDSIRDLEKKVEDLEDIIVDATDDNQTPETIVDKAMALAERQPELASKLIDKFGDKIGTFIDGLSPNVLNGGD